MTGVPPAELPPGSVPDDRRDLVIRNDGSFRSGTWLGHVDGSDPGSTLLIARPTDLRQRFDDFGASVSISIVGTGCRSGSPISDRIATLTSETPSKTSIRRTWSSSGSAAGLPAALSRPAAVSRCASSPGVVPGHPHKRREEHHSWSWPNRGLAASAALLRNTPRPPARRAARAPGGRRRDGLLGLAARPDRARRGPLALLRRDQNPASVRHSLQVCSPV